MQLFFYGILLLSCFAPLAVFSGRRQTFHNVGSLGNRTHEQRRVSARDGEYLLGIKRLRRLYCNVGIGYHIQVLPNGKITGTHTENKYSKYPCRSFDAIHVRRGDWGQGQQNGWSKWLTDLVLVIFNPRPSWNLPSGQRSGDSARADKRIIYCDERQRKALRRRKYPSGIAAGQVLLCRNNGSHREQRWKSQSIWGCGPAEDWENWEDWRMGGIQVLMGCWALSKLRPGQGQDTLNPEFGGSSSQLWTEKSN